MKYKSWIPANNGILSIQRVGTSYPIDSYKNNLDNKTLTFKQENTYSYSDTLEYLRADELPISYILSINYSNDIWKFNLNISVDKGIIVESSGTILENGIVEFDCIYQNNYNNSQSDNMPNTIFTIIKNFIHGNNHHDEKVDNFIPVQLSKSFKYSNILRQLSEKIKSNEFQVKRINYNFIFSTQKQFQLSLLKNEASGYKTYFDTFYDLFKDEIDKENIYYGNPTSVISSISLISEQKNEELRSIQFIAQIIIALIALFISSNIFMKPYSANDFLEYNYITFLNISIIMFVMIIIFFDFIYFGFIIKLSTLLWNKKEYIQRLYLYVNDNPKNNKIKPKEKVIYYILKYIHYPIFFISLYILINTLKKILT